MHFHGRLDNYLGIGVNNLIKDGAILTTNIEDIINNYPQFKNRLCKKDNQVQAQLQSQLDNQVQAQLQSQFDNQIQVQFKNQKEKQGQFQFQNDSQIQIQNKNQTQIFNNQTTDNYKNKIKPEFIEIYNLIKNGYIFLDEILIHISDVKDNNISNISEKLIYMELEGLIKKDISGGYRIIG